MFVSHLDANTDVQNALKGEEQYDLRYSSTLNRQTILSPESTTRSPEYTSQHIRNNLLQPTKSRSMDGGDNHKINVANFYSDLSHSVSYSENYIDNSCTTLYSTPSRVSQVI